MSFERKFNDRIEGVMAEMSKSTEGKRICDWVRANIKDFKEDVQMEGPGCYLTGTYEILFKPDIPDAFLAIVIAHEARHAWQDKQGLMNDANDTVDDGYVYMMRILEADAHREVAMFAYSHAKETGDQQCIDAMLLGRINSYFALKAVSLHMELGHDEMAMHRALFDAFFAPKSPAHTEYSISLRRAAEARGDEKRCIENVCVKSLSKVGWVGGNGESYLDQLVDGAHKPIDGSAYTRGLDSLNGEEFDPIALMMQKRSQKPSTTFALKT